MNKRRKESLKLRDSEGIGGAHDLRNTHRQSNLYFPISLEVLKAPSNFQGCITTMVAHDRK